MRWVMVRVLPVPAPASTHTGPRAAQHRLALLVVELIEMRALPMRGSSTDMAYIMAGRTDIAGDREPRRRGLGNFQRARIR